MILELFAWKSIVRFFPCSFSLDVSYFFVSDRCKERKRKTERLMGTMWKELERVLRVGILPSSGKKDNLSFPFFSS